MSEPMNDLSLWPEHRPPEPPTKSGSATLYAELERLAAEIPAITAELLKTIKEAMQHV